MTYRNTESACKLVQRLFLGGWAFSLYNYSSMLLLCLSIVCKWKCLYMCARACVHVYTPPQTQSSPLHYQIYCKAALWKSTHALPSLCTAPWQLLLYIPLQMRAMNRRDYRVEQKQWGKGGNRKSEASWEREREKERGERRHAVQGEVIEVCCKLYCSSFINHSMRQAMF